MFRVPCRLVNGFMSCQVESLSLTALGGGTERSRNSSSWKMRIGPRPCHVGDMFFRRHVMSRARRMPARRN